MNWELKQRKNEVIRNLENALIRSKVCLKFANKESLTPIEKTWVKIKIIGWLV